MALDIGEKGPVYRLPLMQQAIDQLAFKKNQETRINGLTQKELDAFKRSMQINSLKTEIGIPTYFGINNIPLFHSDLITIPPQVRSVDFTPQASVTSQLIEIWKKALNPVIPINNGSIAIKSAALDFFSPDRSVNILNGLLDKTRPFTYDRKGAINTGIVFTKSV